MAETAKGPVFSTEGYKKLEEELNYLKVTRRKEVAEQIKLAKEYGDLSENAEYDAAKNDQAQVEARIAELEVQLRTAVIVDDEEANNTNRINVGSTVHFRDTVTGKEYTYNIVGANEADPLNGNISSESPVGAALIGHSLNEEISFAVPQGIRHLLILDITRD